MDVYTAISICTGVGMLDHGVNIALGGKVFPILYVEREAFASANLAWQMEKTFLPQAPIWSDVRTLYTEEVTSYLDEILQGKQLDLLYGGIPCQPWSHAGKQHGADDERDLWPSTLDAIAIHQPRIVFIENVSGILSKKGGGDRILSDLQEMGYKVTAGLFSSEEMGANHQRQRVFFMADLHGAGRQRERQAESEERRSEAFIARRDEELVDSKSINEWRHSAEESKEECGEIGGFYFNMADSDDERLQVRENIGTINSKETTKMSERTCAYLAKYHYASAKNDFGAWEFVAEVDPSRMPCIESGFRGMVDGVASRIDRIQCIGNGVDPLVAAYAFVTLWACLQE